MADADGGDYNPCRKPDLGIGAASSWQNGHWLPWTFKQKEDENGQIVRHKARLVAQRFSQRYGIDYDEVFAPVVKQTTLRTLLTIASRDGMITKHLDIKCAYLYASLEEDIL